MSKYRERKGGNRLWAGPGTVLLLVSVMIIFSLTGCSGLMDYLATEEPTVIEETYNSGYDNGSEALDAEDVQSGSAADETSASASEDSAEPGEETDETYDFHFRNTKLLNQHYEKHGIEMGFSSAKDYEAAASAVVNNPDALHKTEAEDGDYIFYLEETNEFVVVSTDGFIRTYFLPDKGKAYYDKQ